jgi:hypothetical protein
MILTRLGVRRPKMKSELSGRVFEWLLANWTDHDSNPADFFSALQNADFDDLTHELSIAIRNAQNHKPVFTKSVKVKVPKNIGSA